MIDLDLHAMARDAAQRERSHDMDFLRADGFRVPRIGLGTWQLEGHTCEEAVREALDLGYRHIDTAQMYDNEDRVGAAIAASGVAREELFLTTKLWRDSLTAAAVARTLQRSLDRLRSDYVDLLLVHWPNEEVSQAETLSAMDRLRKEGKTRLLGVSNYPPDLFLEAASLAPVRCNQVEYHPYLDQRRMVDLARSHHAFFTAYCPLARGEVADDRRLYEIGQRYGKTPPQVVLRWLMQQPQVVAVPKSTKREHLAANLELWDFELGEEDMIAIGQLASGRRLIDPPFAPEW